MKKIWKAIGLIILMLVIYFLAQGVVAFVFGMVHIVRMAFGAAASGTMPDVVQMTEEMMHYIGNQTPWVLFIAVIITLPLYYLIYRGRRQDLWIFVRLGNLHPVSVPVLIVLGLSVNVIIEVVLSLLSQIDVLKQIFSSYDQLAELITGGGFVLSLLAVGIIGPVFEELLFRGLVFGELRKIAKIRLAIVIQALLFGIYHMNPVQGTYAFLIGLLLGYVYYRSNSIAAPMILHITINSSSVIAGRLLGGSSLESWGGAIIIASLLLFVLTGAFILTHRSFRHAMDDSLYHRNHMPDIKPPEENDRQE